MKKIGIVFRANLQRRHRSQRPLLYSTAEVVELGVNIINSLLTSNYSGLGYLPRDIHGLLKPYVMDEREGGQRQKLLAKPFQDTHRVEMLIGCAPRPHKDGTSIDILFFGRAKKQPHFTLTIILSSILPGVDSRYGIQAVSHTTN